MRNIFLLLLLMTLLSSCDKKYGDMSSDQNQVESCNQKKIDISDYYNNYSYINKITFDKSNNMWVATTQGLLLIKNDNSYVKYNTLNTILSDNNILSVTIDKDGNVWMVIYYEIYKFNPVSNSWTKYSYNNGGLPFNNFYYSNVCVASDSGIYTTSHYYLLRYENGVWNTVSYISSLSSNVVVYNSIHNLVKQDSIFWISTTKGLLKYVNDSNYYFYTTENSNISDNSVKEVYIDNDKNKWIITDSGVEMFDGTNWHLYDFLNRVIVKDNIIIASAFNGNYPYSFKNNAWNTIPSICNIHSLYLCDFAIDNQDNVWIASENIIYDFQTNI